MTTETVRLDSLVRRQRAYIKAISTYVDARAKIYSLVLPKTTLYPDGTVTHEYDFTAEQQKTLDLLDEAIESVRKQFMTPNGPLEGRAEAARSADVASPSRSCCSAETTKK